jgi:hypothetical protein
MWSDDLILFCSAVLLSIGAVAAMLVFYLSIKTERAFRRADKDAPRGKGFDIDPLSPRLRSLRADYVKEVHLRTHCTSRRRELIASARRFVAQLPYFRDATEAQERHHLP